MFEETDEEQQDLSDDDDENCTVSVSVRVNDICCFKDPVSTRNDIRVFVTKVVRLTADKSEAYLAELEQVPDSNNLYVLKAGKVWKENCNSLIHPVDIVFNASENAYELRTAKRDIFDIVHG